MQDYRYIESLATLKLDQQTCIGCGNCNTVCPHRIFDMEAKKAVIRDLDACMECGACAKNCPVDAISVTPGVGCAAAIVGSWINTITGRNVLKGCC